MGINAAEIHPMPRQPVEHFFRLRTDARSIVKTTVVNGIIHSIAARIFTIFSPVGGFWFGVAHNLSNRAIEAIYLIGNIDANDRTAKIIKSQLKFFGSPAIAALFTTAIGFPINFFSAIILNLYTVGVVVGGLLCIGFAAVTVTGAIAAIAIGSRMYRDKCNARQAIENIRNDAMRNINNMEVNGIRGIDQLRRLIIETFRRHNIF